MALRAWCASRRTWTTASKAKTFCWWKTSSIPVSRCASCCKHLAGRAPNSLAVCTFLDRKSRRIVQTPVDYRCFEIPDRFVVGFGLDYNQLYRNLGYVAVLKQEKIGE